MTPSSYFDSVRNPSTFKLKARSENAQVFRSLHNANDTDDARLPVSLWGREHLFALRVLCATPTPNLTVLEPYLPAPSDGTLLDPRLQALIDGPNQDIMTLSKMSEPEIVRSYDPDSLGSVWAALGALLRPRDNEDHGQHDSEGRLRRNRQPTKFYGSPVPTGSVQFGSSPPDERPSTSSTVESIGYTENLQAPAVEDLTLRLASCFVRYVLNYGQKLSAQVVEFRDERATVSYLFESEPRYRVLAIDDGGVRMFQAGQNPLNVALIEAKRRFQVIEDGRPTVSDGLLAQMVGQALTLLVSRGPERVRASRQVA